MSFGGFTFRFSEPFEFGLSGRFSFVLFGRFMFRFSGGFALFGGFTFRSGGVILLFSGWLGFRLFGRVSLPLVPLPLKLSLGWPGRVALLPPRLKFSPLAGWRPAFLAGTAPL